MAILFLDLDSLVEELLQGAEPMAALGTLPAPPDAAAGIGSAGINNLRLGR